MSGRKDLKIYIHKTVTIEREQKYRFQIISPVFYVPLFRDSVWKSIWKQSQLSEIFPLI